MVKIQVDMIYFFFYFFSNYIFTGILLKIIRGGLDKCSLENTNWHLELPSL